MAWRRSLLPRLRVPLHGHVCPLTSTPKGHRGGRTLMCSSSTDPWPFPRSSGSRRGRGCCQLWEERDTQPTSSKAEVCMCPRRCANERAPAGQGRAVQHPGGLLSNRQGQNEPPTALGKLTAQPRLCCSAAPLPPAPGTLQGPRPPTPFSPELKSSLPGSTVLWACQLHLKTNKGCLNYPLTPAFTWRMDN